MLTTRGSVAAQALAVLVAALGLGLLGVPRGMGGAGSSDGLLLEMIEARIPADLKALFDRTYPDKQMLVARVRELQRVVSQFALEFSDDSAGAGPGNDSQLSDDMLAQIVAERFCASDPALRQQVEQIIDLGALQQWAIRTMGARRPGGNHRIVQWEDINAPEPLKQLGGYLVFTGPSDHDTRSVRICLGGGFHHYGIEIGRAGFEPEPDSSWSYYRWADGIWGFQEK